MLTRLREIVEKVASAPRLNEALNILVTDICLAMDTEVCSVYLADHDRRCYYLMATRGLKKPRGRTVTLAFDEGIVGLVGRLAEPINLADAQKHPSFKYIPSVKEERFRAFLGVPIIQRRQLLGVLVVQQRELRQYDESEESFLVTLATQMAAILSQSQLTALFGQYRQTRIRALPAAPGVAIAEGWQDATLPLMEQVYQASTLDPALERERLTGALEEAANEFRRYSKRFAAGAQKETAAIFDLYSHLLSDTRLRRELFAEVDKGSVAEWAVKTVIEKFAEQFAALSDNYLKERAGDLRALGQRLLFHLDDANQGPNAWPERFILVADELSATTPTKRSWAAVLMASVFIALKSHSCCKVVSRRKKNRWRSIRGCCKCSMINPSPCVRWMSEQISSCLTCRSAKRIHAWVGVGFALRSISRRSS